jgi:hypothetical protein
MTYSVPVFDKHSKLIGVATGDLLLSDLHVAEACVLEKKTLRLFKTGNGGGRLQKAGKRHLLGLF